MKKTKPQAVIVVAVEAGHIADSCLAQQGRAVVSRFAASVAAAVAQLRVLGQFREPGGREQFPTV